MYVSMKNAAGHIRQVKVGAAWLPLLFGGLPFFFRGMPGRAILWTLLSYTLLLPAIYLVFVMNRMTARHWLARGYRPIGDGWDYARQKWRLPAPATEAVTA
jgi:hypothetical protein